MYNLLFKIQFGNSLKKKFIFVFARKEGLQGEGGGETVSCRLRMASDAKPPN